MAGFAVGLDYLDKYPNATMPYKAGFEEDGFLKSIGLKMDEIEPKAKNCTDILVWHTQTKKEKPALIHIDSRIVESEDSSLGALLRALDSMGVSHTDSSSGRISNKIASRLDCITFAFFLSFFPLSFINRCKSANWQKWKSKRDNT